MNGELYNAGYDIGIAIANVICTVAPFVIVAIVAGGAYLIYRKRKTKNNTSA